MAEKCLRFNEDFNILYLLDEDEEDYKNYRKIYWELFVIDRWRFQQRINNVVNILNLILNKSHRQLIFNKRFSSARVCK